jgi:hypothetical protein
MRDGAVRPEDQELLDELRRRLRLPATVAAGLFRYAVEEYEAGLLPPAVGPTMPRIVAGAQALLGSRTPTEREARRLELLRRMAADRTPEGIFLEASCPAEEMLTSMQGEVVPELMEVDWGEIGDLPDDLELQLEADLDPDPDATTEENPTYDGSPAQARPPVPSEPPARPGMRPAIARHRTQEEPPPSPPPVLAPGSRAIRYLVRRYRSRQIRHFVHEADSDLAALRSLLCTGVYVLLVLGALVRGGFFEGVEVAGWGAALALGVYAGRVLHLKVSQRHLEWVKTRS